MAEELIPTFVWADSNPPDAGKAKCSPPVKSLLDRLDCPPIGKRDLNLFLCDSVRSKAADANAKPGSEAPQPARTSVFKCK